MQKQTLVGVGAVAVIVIGLLGFVFWQWRHDTASTVLRSNAGQQTASQSEYNPLTDGSSQQNLQQSSDSVPIGGSTNTQQESNALKVGNGTGLGGGLAFNDPNGSNAASGSNSSNQNNKLPGPESFGQYDQYKNGNSALFGDISVGNGAVAQENKKVAVLYKGWLTNGSLFDQSRLNKDNAYEPFVFTLGANQVIPGWEQGISGMKVGGVRRLIIPPAVGYGAAGKDPIPPNSVLIFDVQLVAVE